MIIEELARNIYATSHLTGDFLLRSGTRSNEYFDKYQFESRPELLIEIARNFMLLIENKVEFSVLAGLEMGGIPLATTISLLCMKPVVFVRKEAKKYGTCKAFEGVDINGETLLAVEDVVTSGGQVITSIEDLRKSGAIINHAICVIDRQAGGKEALEKIGVKLISLFTMSELKEIGS